MLQKVGFKCSLKVGPKNWRMNRSDLETLIECNRDVITKNDNFLIVYVEIIWIINKNDNLGDIFSKLNSIILSHFCSYS
jgi:hypothetical protein